MVTEVAQLQVDPHQAEGFENTYLTVAPILRRQAGFQGDRLLRSIEHPGQYILAVEWDAVADHQRFIDSADYPDLDGPLSEFVQEGSFAHSLTVS